MYSWAKATPGTVAQDSRRDVSGVTKLGNLCRRLLCTKCEWSVASLSHRRALDVYFQKINVSMNFVSDGVHTVCSTGGEQYGSREQPDSREHSNLVLVVLAERAELKMLKREWASSLMERLAKLAENRSESTSYPSGRRLMGC